MMKRINYIIGVVVAMFGIYSCIEPFTPPETNADQGYLVVDGFLNVSNDTSFITLRRTQNIHDFSMPSTVSNATLYIVSEQEQIYQFNEMGNGQYYLPPYDFSLQNRYQLNIILDNGNTYQSEFVGVSNTPDIDSITYRIDDHMNSVVINVNTHDETNTTRFYRWRFEETHEYVMPYYSSLIGERVIEGGRPRNIITPRPENINRCWRTDVNKNILLGSTIKQSHDAILSLPVNNVPIETNKFLIKYSILVKQYGLTREAFEYWTTLAKTTQGTGTLFDPLPSLVTGNIRNRENKDDLVFGYFSAGVEKEMRIFINEGLGKYTRCVAPDTLSVGDETLVYAGILLNYIGERSDSVLVTSPDCADCRLQGGTIIRPSYWL